MSATESTDDGDPGLPKSWREWLPIVAFVIILASIVAFLCVFV